MTPWRKEWRVSRPYLNEDIVGDGFEFGKFIIFLVFIGVIGGQTALMLPMLKNISIFKTTKNTQTYTIGEVAKMKQGVSPSGGISMDDNKAEENITVENITVEVGETDPVSSTQTVQAEPLVTEAPIPTQITIQPTEKPVAAFIPGVACEDCKQYKIEGRFTHYWPDKYPSDYKKIEGSNYVRTMNCWEYDLGKKKCVSNMASDLPWEPFVGMAAACPLDFPFGTRIEIMNNGRVYYCLDRGSMICSGGVCDFDILDRGISFDGQVLEAMITVPGW